MYNLHRELQPVRPIPTFGLAFNRVPFTSQVYKAECLIGMSIFDIIASVPEKKLPPLFEINGTVRLNGHIIERKYWTKVYPKEGSRVTLHSTPMGGGGDSSAKNIGVILASVALVAITGFIGAGGLAALGAGGFFAAGSLGAALASAAVGAAGLLAINALSPTPESPKQIEQNPTQGTSSADGNVAPRGGRPYRVVGTHKVYPTMAMEPFYYINGDDEYIEAIYMLDGPHKWEDIRIDGSPIDSLEDTEYEISEGFGNEDDFDFITHYAYTDSSQVELSRHDLESDGETLKDQDNPENSIPKWTVVATRDDPDEIWIDLAWPEGVFDTDNAGTSFGIPYRFRMKVIGTDTYVNLPEIHFRGKKAGLYRKSVRIIRGGSGGSVVAPETNAFIYGYHEVPAQDVTPVGSGDQWNADSHFINSAAINDIDNVRFYDDRVEIFLSEALMPQDQQWQVEIISGYPYVFANFDEATYEEQGDVIDFFRWRGTAPNIITEKNVQSVSYKTLLLRTVSVYNSSPLLSKDVAYLAIRGKNRNISKVSAIASAYVRDYGYEAAAHRWDFTNDAEGWTAFRADHTVSAGKLTHTANTNDPFLRGPAGLTIDGSKYNLIRIRLRRLTGTGWDGQIYWDIVDAGFPVYTRSRFASEPAWDGNFLTVEWSMDSLNGAGSQEWVGQTINLIEVHLGAFGASDDSFEIDYIEIVRRRDISVAKHFFVTTEGATVSERCTLAQSVGALQVTHTGTPEVGFQFSGFDFYGGDFRYVRIRARRTAGTGGFRGAIFPWEDPRTAPDGGLSSAFVSAPADETAWNIFEWDMFNLFVGDDSRWKTGQIKGMRIDLGLNDATGVWEVDWVEVTNSSGGVEEEEGWYAFRPTSNPVPHYIDHWCFEANPDPLPLSILDETQLLEWKDFCDTQGFQCNHVIDNSDIVSVARLLAACGRGQLKLSDTLGVLYDYDRSAETIANLLTPRNTREFSFSKLFTRPPNAFFVRFIDRDRDYRENYVLVENPYVVDWDSNYIEEEVNYAGLVTQAEVERRALYDFRQLRYRDIGYTQQIDIEQLAIDRGSLIGANHYSIQSTMSSQRIREIYTSGPNITGFKMETPFQQYFNGGVFASTGILAEVDIFTLGLQTQMSIRMADGDVEDFLLTGTTQESVDVTLDTPIATASYPDLVEDSLCSFSAISETYFRAIVVGIAPQDDITATVSYVEEAALVNSDLI